MRLSVRRATPCLLAVTVCVLAAHAQAAPAYRFTDLGEGIGYAINDLGQVAGAIDFQDPDSYPGYFNVYSHAALFSAGQITDLGTLAPGNPRASSYATAINGAGQVAGWSEIPSTYTDPRGHVYGYSAFISQNGQAMALSPDTSAKATAINKHGQVAVTSGDVSFYSDSDSRRSHIYSQGLATPITSPAGPIGVKSLNDQGQATGDFGTVNTSSTDDIPHAYIYSNNSVTDLGTLGGLTSSGRDINNLGQVTGIADIGSGISHAFVYSQGRMVDLGTLGGPRSEGLAINDRGEVVGFSSGSSSSPLLAFLYSGGQMINLQSLMAPTMGAGWALVQANDINSNGNITGLATFNGVSHAFLLTAVPEPDTIALALSGLIGVGVSLRRRKRRQPAR